MPELPEVETVARTLRPHVQDRIIADAQVLRATSQHALRLVLQRVWDSPDPAYRAYQQRSLSQACQAFARIHASTTPAQRAQAVRVLKGYEADLRALASQR